MTKTMRKIVIEDPQVIQRLELADKDLKRNMINIFFK